MAMISSRVLPALLPITANNMFLPLRIKLQPALLLGDVRRLHPVVRSQLLDGCREVVAHRSLGQRERVRNLRDSRAMRRGGQHLTLALGEGIGARRERLGGERGINHMLAGHHPPNCRRKLRRWGILQEIARCAALHRAPQVAGPPEGGQDEDAARGQLRMEIRRRRDAVTAGHLDVEQRHVRPGFQRRRQHLVAPTHFGYDLEVILQREQRGQRAAYQRLVLRQQYPHHAVSLASSIAALPPPVFAASAEPRAGARTFSSLLLLARWLATSFVSPSSCCAGMETARRNPPPAPGPASKRPPSASTRSASPRRPLPSLPLLPSSTDIPIGLRTAPIQPPPSSPISIHASWPARMTRMWQWRARLWRITFVTPSRTVHDSTASAVGESEPSRRSSASRR